MLTRRFFLFLLLFGLGGVLTPISGLADSPAAYPVYPQIPRVQNQQENNLILKGEYLAKAGDCIACHSDPKHGGKAFAGGLGIKTPFGTFYSPNITPDKKTGIGSWTDAEFIRAMQEGIGPQGNYFPVFPYNYFTRVNTQDLLAIKKYLETIPAVDRPNTPHDVLPPFSWRFLQWGWKLLFFEFHKGVYHYDKTQSAEWNRGAYLVTGLGHCAMCHSPLNLLGAVKSGQALTGGFIEGYYAPDITSRGLNGANIDDIMKVFSKGEMLRGAGKVQGPMAEAVRDSLQYLTPDDWRAMAVYLKSVPNNLPIQKTTGKITANTGREIYENHCAVCHNVGAAGAPKFGDVSAWQGRITQGMDVIFKHALNGYNSMPPKGACISCSDDEIKAAVTYLVDNSKPGAKGIKIQKLYIPTQPPLTLEDGKNIYEKHCAVCHSNPHNTLYPQTPQLGDKKQWAEIMNQNMDIIFKRAISGHKSLQGGNNCQTCSDGQVIAAAKYMAQQSQSGGNYLLW